MNTSHRSPSKRRTLLVIALVVIAALIAWGLVRIFAAGKKPEPAQPPVQVTLAVVGDQDFSIYVAGVGTVQPNASVTVKARVDGQLQKLGYNEGQDVKAGQLLAQIDPRPLQAQLAQVAAQKARDQAQLANAQLDLKRYSELIKEEATSRQQLDTQQAQVAQLEAAVKTDEAQINYAKTQLDYTTITAPISGRTGLRLVDVGNIVHASDTTGLVVIDQIDPISVVFTLPDASFQKVNQAMRASREPLRVVTYARDSDRPLAKGALVLVDNHIDTTSGTVQLKASFTNATHVLWPGQYVNVHLFIGTLQHALVVPAAAVQRSQRGTYAYVVGADDKAQMQAIDVALIQDGQAVIDKGLSAGQKVVVDGQYKVKPGIRIAASNNAPANQLASDAPTATADPAEGAAPEKKR